MRRALIGTLALLGVAALLLGLQEPVPSASAGTAHAHALAAEEAHLARAVVVARFGLESPGPTLETVAERRDARAQDLAAYVLAAADPELEDAWRDYARVLVERRHLLELFQDAVASGKRASDLDELVAALTEPVILDQLGRLDARLGALGLVVQRQRDVLRAGLVLALLTTGLVLQQLIRKDGQLDRLNATLEERIREGSSQLAQAQKLEAIGQLAAGVAHEINTPAQFVSDNLCFVRDSLPELRPLTERGLELLDAPDDRVASLVAEMRKEVDAEQATFLRDEIPKALAESLDGIQRIAEIVRAMKEFSHPGSKERAPTDLNHALRTAATVSRNEWKNCAELVLELDDDLPEVWVLAGEFNQAILNILVNAAHAIAEKQRKTENREPGRITLRTRRTGDWAEVEIEDSGCGIPDEIITRVFDPFFTTKGVGRGTGQGLAIARSVVVNKHGGSLDVASTPGAGTRFVIRLPLGEPPEPEEDA